VLLSDTVGFVRKLPHQLVESFRSTLDEVASADLLVHVVDGSSPLVDEQLAAVNVVLEEIGAGDVPVLVAYNKSDVAVPEHREPGSVVISARTGAGIDDLLVGIGDRLRSLNRVVELLVPYTRGDVLAALHRAGEVLVEMHDGDATRVRARLDQADAARFGEFCVS
jgi:GTP-binding protein HflX